MLIITRKHKSVLRDCQRHTAHHVASTHSAVPAGGGGRGVPHLVVARRDPVLGGGWAVLQYCIVTALRVCCVERSCNLDCPHLKMGKVLFSQVSVHT